VAILLNVHVSANVSKVYTCRWIS